MAVWAAGVWAAGLWADGVWFGMGGGSPPTPTPDPVATATPRSGAVPGIISPSIQAQGRILRDDGEVLAIMQAMIETGLLEAMRDEH